MTATEIALRLVVFLAVLGWSGVALYRGVRSGTFSDARLRRMSWSAVVLSALALPLLLLVITARVPGQLKDGLFGSAVGLVMVVLVLNALLGIAHLARSKPPASNAIGTEV